jgi:RNA 2',3'-cyclic 3'-phosphodiesterase
MMIRSFLAFELPGPMKTVLSETLKGLKGMDLDVRWTAVDKIHLTVVFLGDVSNEQIDFIKESAATVCAGHDSFTVAVKGVGVFGPPRRPRVVWAGLSGETSRMAVFKRELLDALAPAELKLDARSLRPHLTLGRFRSGGPGNILERFDHIRSDECRLGELVLFKSDLTPRGAVYTVLGRMPMRDTAGSGRQQDR